MGCLGGAVGDLLMFGFFCLLSFYRLVFSFSAVRCSKAERKRKENGRQTGTLGGRGCTFWVLRLVVIVLFSSVQFSSVSLPAGGVTRVQSVECGSCGQQGVTASAGEMHGAGVCVRVCMCVYD